MGSITADFAKRKNISVVAYGHQERGKSYTLDHLIPSVITTLKPTLQNAEQIALEAVAEQQADDPGTNIEEETKAAVDPMPRRPTKPEGSNANRTPRSKRALTTTTTQHGSPRSGGGGRGYGQFTLSPKVIVAHSSPNRRQPQGLFSTMGAVSPFDPVEGEAPGDDDKGVENDEEVRCVWP